MEPSGGDSKQDGGYKSHKPHGGGALYLLLDGSVAIKEHIKGGYRIVEHVAYDAWKQAPCAVVEPTEYGAHEEGEGYLRRIHVYNAEDERCHDDCCPRAF